MANKYKKKLTFTNEQEMQVKNNLKLIFFYIHWPGKS